MELSANLQIISIKKIRRKKYLWERMFDALSRENDYSSVKTEDEWMNSVKNEKYLWKMNSYNTHTPARTHTLTHTDTYTQTRRRLITFFSFPYVWYIPKYIVVIERIHQWTHLSEDRFKCVSSQAVMHVA